MSATFPSPAVENHSPYIWRPLLLRNAHIKFQENLFPNSRVESCNEMAKQEWYDHSICVLFSRSVQRIYIHNVTGSRYADCHCYPTGECRHCYAASKRSIVISMVTGSYSKNEPTAMHCEWTTDVSPATKPGEVHFWTVWVGDLYSVQPKATLGWTPTPTKSVRQFESSSVLQFGVSQDSELTGEQLAFENESAVRGNTRISGTRESTRKHNC
jgi:hypothetical protein